MSVVDLKQFNYPLESQFLQFNHISINIDISAKQKQQEFFPELIIEFVCKNLNKCRRKNISANGVAFELKIVNETPYIMMDGKMVQELPFNYNFDEPFELGIYANQHEYQLTYNKRIVWYGNYWQFPTPMHIDFIHLNQNFTTKVQKYWHQVLT
jgi:hypothetical protein